MIYPDTPLEAWLSYTGLTPEEFECPQCGQVFMIDIPVVNHDYFGLHSKLHSCGDGFYGSVLIARSDVKKKEWLEISENL